jgi:hypothetical protein
MRDAPRRDGRARFVLDIEITHDPVEKTMHPRMRPSFEALPSWLSRVPAVPPTPVRSYVPPDESLLQRTLRNARLPVHVAVLAIGVGVVAAIAAGSVRVKYTAESRAEMSAFATRKVAELRAFGTLRALPSRHAGLPLPLGGSLTDDVPGYYDVVDGTDGRRFHRRWAIDVNPAGQRRIVVRVIPATREAGRSSLDLTTVLTH